MATQSDSAVLYSFRRCPYAMRARMALKVSELAYEHREIILRDKPHAMLAASPKGTVPVFVKPNGAVIDESLDLALFALSQNDPQNWLEDYEPELIAQNDGPFKHHLDRYKYASRFDEAAKRGDVDLSHREKAEAILEGLENRLAVHAYLSGPRQSFTDIAIFPFIRQFSAVEPEWVKGRFPALSEWLARHVESPLFKSVMTKYPLWQPPIEDITIK